MCGQRSGGGVGWLGVFCAANSREGWVEGQAGKVITKRCDGGAAAGNTIMRQALGFEIGVLKEGCFVLCVCFFLRARAATAKVVWCDLSFFRCPSGPI